MKDGLLGSLRVLGDRVDEPPFARSGGQSDDLAAIQRVLRGEVEAFRALVERYQARLFSMVGSLLSDANDRDDVVQETFLAAYVKLRSYDPRKAKFSTWLFTIARNASINLLKKRKPVHLEESASQISAHGPGDGLVEAELFARLDAALAELPLDQKTVFVLAEIQGLSYEEISQIEGVPVGTVKSRVSRAKEKLRARLPRES